MFDLAVADVAEGAAGVEDGTGRFAVRRPGACPPTRNGAGVSRRAAM